MRKNFRSMTIFPSYKNFKLFFLLKRDESYFKIIRMNVSAYFLSNFVVINHISFVRGIIE